MWIVPSPKSPFRPYKTLKSPAPQHRLYSHRRLLAFTVLIKGQFAKKKKRKGKKSRCALIGQSLGMLIRISIPVLSQRGIALFYPFE